MLKSFSSSVRIIFSCFHEMEIKLLQRHLLSCIYTVSSSPGNIRILLREAFLTTMCRPKLRGNSTAGCWFQPDCNWMQLGSQAASASCPRAGSETRVALVWSSSEICTERVLMEPVVHSPFWMKKSQTETDREKERSRLSSGAWSAREPQHCHWPPNRKPFQPVSTPFNPKHGPLLFTDVSTVMSEHNAHTQWRLITINYPVPPTARCRVFKSPEWQCSDPLRVGVRWSVTSVMSPQCQPPPGGDETQPLPPRHRT